MTLPMLAKTRAPGPPFSPQRDANEAASLQKLRARRKENPGPRAAGLARFAQAGALKLRILSERKS